MNADTSSDHYYGSRPETIVVIVVSLFSAALCAILAINLFVSRRYKIHYRLCIGLLISFFVYSCISVSLLIAFLCNAIDIQNYSYWVTPITTTPILYIAAICLDYLLREKGYTEESLHGKDKWWHLAIWSYTLIAYILIFSNVISHNYNGVIEHLIGFMLYIILCTTPIFIVGTTIYIAWKLREAYVRQGEVNSPLLKSNKISDVYAFQTRLVFLVILALVAMGNTVISFSLFLRNSFHVLWVLLGPVTYMFVSVLIASSPELKRYWKRKKFGDKEQIFATT